MPDSQDFAITYYNAARAEILQRLGLREQVLLAGIAAFGLVAGAAFANGSWRGLIGLLPPLSFGFTVMFFRHHYVITELSHYLNNELQDPLHVRKSSAPMPFHWDEWLAYGRGKSRTLPRHRLLVILSFELFGGCLLLWIPALMAFIYGVVSHEVGTAYLWLDFFILIVTLLPYAAEADRLRRDVNSNPLIDFLVVHTGPDAGAIDPP
jgi:hypothetical protein